MRASLGSGKTTLDTRILASLLMRVATESTLVDTVKTFRKKGTKEGMWVAT